MEYNEAKLNLTKALSDKLQAKYDYLFRTKILDFYQRRNHRIEQISSYLSKALKIEYIGNVFYFLRLYSCFQTPQKQLVIYVRDF